MNFKKIHESGLSYAKGTDGPFEKWSTAIEKGKEQKPAIKGKPHFKVEKASEPPTNKPTCPYATDTYNVKYSKCGCLTEEEYKELKDILNESEDDDFSFEEDYLVDENDFDSVFDPIESIDDEDLEDDEMREFADWKKELEELDDGYEPNLTDMKDYGFLDNEEF